MPFLDGVNKAQAVSSAADVPYHLLQFESAHGDASAENLLIQGDNLKAMKALLPFYRGQVKCIYADPPFNTEQAFPDYDDKLEHSQWLPGNRINLEEARRKASDAKKAAARVFADRMRPEIERMQASGTSLNKISDRLNALRVAE